MKFPAGSDATVRSVMTTVAAVALVILAVAALRGGALLQNFELAAYDQFLRWRPSSPTRQPVVAIVAIDDEDLEKWGWPLPDERLAALVKAALEAGARVVGVDLYRDKPIPPGSKTLNSLLSREHRVIGVTKLASKGQRGVGPPPSLLAAKRYGFADMVVDRDGRVRRGFLFMQDGPVMVPSFGLRLALAWLRDKGIGPAPDSVHPTHMRLGAATFRPLVRNFGGYRGIDSRGYQFMLDFRRGRDWVPIVPASSLAKKSRKLDLEDSIVIVAILSGTVKDQFTTPLDGEKGFSAIPGAVLHALLADQIIRRATGPARAARSLEEWQEFTLVALLGLATAVGAYFVRRPSLVVPGTAAVVAATLAGAYLLFVSGWWLPAVPAALCVTASAVAVIAVRTTQERRLRAALMQIFSSQVSPPVAQELWRHRHLILEGGRPIPQRLTVTVMFVDLAGSTAAAETMTPDSFMRWIGDYLGHMATVVVQHGGLIEKYTGDGLMVVFGAPVPRTRDDEIAADAEAAARCALAMCRRIEEQNEHNPQTGGPALRVRIGIDSGPVSAGTVGAKERMQYTVIGQPANIAARLESHAKDDPDAFVAPDGSRTNYRILLTSGTARLLADGFELFEEGEVDLRGRSTPTTIYRLLPEAKKGRKR